MAIEDQKQHRDREKGRGVLGKITLWLLCAAILLVMIYLVPTAPSCWIPPHAPTRGIYDACWGYWDLWA